MNYSLHPQINSTENRSVLHIALRAPRDKPFYSDGKNVVPDVWHVLVSWARSKISLKGCGMAPR